MFGRGESERAIARMRRVVDQGKHTLGVFLAPSVGLKREKSLLPNSSGDTIALRRSKPWISLVKECAIVGKLRAAIRNILAPSGRLSEGERLKGLAASLRTSRDDGGDGNGGRGDRA